MKRQTKLYNVIFPIWLILFLPTYLWLIIIPGNLAVDCLVTFLVLRAWKFEAKRDVLKHTWWRFWLLGFAADFIGGLWMLFGLLGPYYIYFGLTGHDQTLDAYPPLLDAWERTVGQISHNSFANPWAFLWTLAGVAISGVCIYFFDKKALKKCTALDDRQKHLLALIMAAATAPWLFFIHIY